MSLKLQLIEREKVIVGKNEEINTIKSEAAKLSAQIGKSETVIQDLKDSFQLSKAEWSKEKAKLEKEKERLTAKIPNDLNEDKKIKNKI